MDQWARRKNRTIKQATVDRYHYKDLKQLKKHLDSFIKAYNYGKPLKALKGLTPFEKILIFYLFFCFYNGFFFLLQVYILKNILKANACNWPKS